jgi:hypothetical protein
LHVGQLLFDQFEAGQRLSKLHAPLRVFDRPRDAKLGGSGAAGAERGASEIEHCERYFEPFAQLPQHVFARHEHVVERQPAGGRAADAALFHPLFDDFKAGHVGRDDKRRDLGLSASGHGRAGHHRQDVGDAAVGDPALLAIDDKAPAIGRGRAGDCTLAASLPASGSVRAKALIHSPLASLGSHRACCSGVPNSTIARGPIE